MPNTKSAERRMRNSARKESHNTSAKSRLHTLETTFDTLVGQGKKDDASAALRSLSSALDKAAKVGVVHKSVASRKKSRLTLRLNKVGVAATPAAPAAPAAAPAASPAK
jgi:small subunit ribosomal protein S20